MPNSTITQLAIIQAKARATQIHTVGSNLISIKFIISVAHCRLDFTKKNLISERTATNPYNGTGSQTQTAQIRSIPDVKPVSAAVHTYKLPSASKINHDDVKIYSKRLGELPQFPSISLMSKFVSLIISSFWPPNYIEEKAVTVTREKRSRSVKITPGGRRDSITPESGAYYDTPMEPKILTTIMMTNETRPCFTTQHQTYKTKTKTKTDFFSLRPVLSSDRRSQTTSLTTTCNYVNKLGVKVF